MKSSSKQTRYEVGVLFGGKSTEHEVSIVSAMQVVQFLAGRHHVIPIYIAKDGTWLTSEKLIDLSSYSHFETILKECTPVAFTPDPVLQVINNPMSRGIFGKAQSIKIDVVFPVFHGLHGEDGTIQGLLELTDIPYVGSGVLASAIGIDKIVTKQLLSAHTIPILDYYSFSRFDWENSESEILKEIQEKHPFPLIVKPARLGSSIGVKVAKDMDELGNTISIASRLDTRILIEPYLVNCIEVNCSVLGNEHNPIASTTEQPIHQGDLLSFEDKYIHEGRERGMDTAQRIIPAPVTEGTNQQIQALAIQVFKILGCKGVARVDFLVDRDSGKVFVNEINTLPGSIAYYLWKEEPHKMSPEQLVDRLIELALESYQEKKRTKFTTDQVLLGNINLLALKKG
jgi:D-alanine-D-alanine ligase